MMIFILARIYFRKWASSFFSCSGSTCLFRRPRACCWLLHWTSPSLRTSSHSPCACARSPTAPTSPKNCARCASLSLSLSLPLASRLNGKRAKKKRRMTALPTDQVLLLLRSCGTLFLILSLFLSYVFSSSWRCYQCFFLGRILFPSSWCCCWFFFCMLLRFRVVFVCCMHLAIIVVVVVVVVVSVVLRVSVIFHRL